ncbi:sensor histidine kinase [Cellulomonas cellasea]|uniref:histidine kinase n=2 Tax=Cellulomonas cellasea TaxID=43670 RepID=A0A0A0BCM0_9CELL|nr:HAMP domain-containing sensor histidine kinase [Cellulomonas cellasea]KGM03837.1 histidine kinase [Cellulomonas cellasea DSM 20118]GEA87255.1 two-component sensor histidine kinase [Cellulomonas cellasea]
MTTRPGGPPDGARAGLRTSARLRLTVSYVAFLLVAGLVMSVCIWAVLRFVPNYPLTAANPRDLDSPIASRGEILDAVVQACAVALAVLTVVGSVGGWWLARRVLTPLQHLNAAARAAADGDLSRRVGSQGSRRDEFTDLADTFDSMLDRLERDLHAQRRFAANASHELRTPLAVMRAMVDVAREDPDDVDLPVLLQRLDETTQRATNLVTALLDLAALDRGAVGHRLVDLDVLVADAVDDLMPEARSRGVTVTAGIDRATVLGDETLLLRAVDNLLRNAVRHNRPEGGRVVVTLGGGGGGGDRDGDGRVRFRVENDGARVDVDALRLAVEPFTRRVDVVGVNAAGSGTGDGSTRSHGLGLPLTERIVTVHGGSLLLVPRPEGGVVATVTLPAEGASRVREA